MVPLVPIGRTTRVARLAGVGLLIGLTAMATACGSNPSRASVSAREYARIEVGMTYPQVRRIVGGPGELTSSTSNAAGFRGRVYTWPGPDGSTVRVRFANGTVFTKTRTAAG
jgi:hypothetical protein